MKRTALRGRAALALAAVSLMAQSTPPPTGIPPYRMQPTPLTQQPPPPSPQAPPAGVPARPAQGNPAQAPPAAQQAPRPATQTAAAQDTGSFGGLTLQNASLTEVIDLLARQLKINYILDPRVRGSVNLNTYGETKDIDPRSLLNIILRINGFGMVQVGDIYRIVPLNEASSQPLSPTVNATTKDIPAGDDLMLNLIFLKYASAEDVQKIIAPSFIGEGARTWVYQPANLLFILDSKRNIRRTMELIGLFDNDSFAGQRIRNFEVKNGRPSDVSRELDQIFKAISLNEKATPLKFLPLDRINTIIGIAANPAAFEQVEKWLQKLDVEVKPPVGAIDNYVYRVRYGQAMMIAQAIMALYTGGGFGGGYGQGGFGQGMFGPGITGSPYGGGGMSGYGGAGGAGYGNGYSGGAALGLGNAYQGGVTPAPGGTIPLGPNTPTAAPGQTGVAGIGQTGDYLGNSPIGLNVRIPRVVPNPMDNSLLIQGTPQEYQSILKLLRELDIPPRQVLIEAKIYEVQLNGAFASGVSAALQHRGGTFNGTKIGDVRPFVANLVDDSTNLSAGLLVGKSRELLAFLQLKDTASRTKVISAPNVIATDSIPATIVVGQEVPTLTASVSGGVQNNGNLVVANSVQNRNTGVTLSIVARVNSSGIVTMFINQEVSSPGTTTTSNIQSPSFSKRSVQTQVTVEDGDTIAVGGIILENNLNASSGLPGLHRLPVVGNVFGSKSYSRDRTELIVFFTPRVIYDTTQTAEATEELRSKLRKLNRVIKD